MGGSSTGENIYAKGGEIMDQGMTQEKAKPIVDRTARLFALISELGCGLNELGKRLEPYSLAKTQPPVITGAVPNDPSERCAYEHRLVDLQQEITNLTVTVNDIINRLEL